MSTLFEATQAPREHFSSLYKILCQFSLHLSHERLIPNTSMNDTYAEPPPNPQFWESRAAQSPPILRDLGGKDLHHSQTDLVLVNHRDPKR